jgi:hypothetical protein
MEKSELYPERINPVEEEPVTVSLDQSILSFA